MISIIRRDAGQAPSNYERRDLLPDPFHVVPDDARRGLHVAKGGVAFRQGERTRGLFFVVDGVVELRRVTEAGDVVVLHRAATGETFAEASLFSETYHCDAVAIEATDLVELDRAHILRAIRSDVDFAMALSRRFATQIQAYRRKLELLAIRSAEGRVHAALADGMLTADIKSLAAEIGLTHEAVYRALASLVKQGRVKKRGHGRYDVVGAGR